MKGTIALWIGISIVGFAAVGLAQTPASHEPPQPAAVAKAPEGLKLETLLSAKLEGVENTEVFVSRVTIPPNSSLPKHWHPGEEFAYVLAGTAVLWQDGKADITAKAGDVLKVPLKQVHTAVTGEEGATILVFRVHEKGKPERVPVD